MSYELNSEKATNVLIWWVESSDGNIDYREKEEVENILKEMNYDMETFYEETMVHISGLSAEKIELLIADSIRWGAEHYDKQRKKETVTLLKEVAQSDGNIDEDQENKLDRIKDEWGIA